MLHVSSMRQASSNRSVLSNLAQQATQFNATQANAQAQFNAGQANTVERFNAEMNNQRDQFNAQNQQSLRSQMHSGVGSLLLQTLLQSTVQTK